MKSREDLTENTVPPPLVLQELLKKDPNFDTYGSVCVSLTVIVNA